jgi:iron complex outermembrane receptor protein
LLRLLRLVGVVRARVDLPDIPAYFTADVRLGWRPREDLELSVVGQNLLDSPHQEFRSSLIGYNPSVITRAIFGRITWSF